MVGYTCLYVNYWISSALWTCHCRRLCLGGAEPSRRPGLPCDRTIHPAGTSLHSPAKGVGTASGSQFKVCLSSCHPDRLASIAVCVTSHPFSPTAASPGSGSQRIPWKTEHHLWLALMMSLL